MSEVNQAIEMRRSLEFSGSITIGHLEWLYDIYLSYICSVLQS